MSSVAILLLQSAIALLIFVQTPNVAPSVREKATVVANQAIRRAIEIDPSIVDSILESLDDEPIDHTDAAIKSYLNNSRAQAELYYDTNDSSYEGLCTDSTIRDIKESVNDVGGTFSCSAAATEYRISSPLKGNTALHADYYCVDSTGAASTEDFIPSGTRCLN